MANRNDKRMLVSQGVLQKVEGETEFLQITSNGVIKIIVQKSRQQTRKR